MNDYIVTILKTEGDWQNDPELPGYYPKPKDAVKLIGQLEHPTDDAYMTTNLDGWPASMTVVGEWDSETGAPIGVIQSSYAEWIRPLGNEDGIATDSLRATHIYLGHSRDRFYDYVEIPEEPPVVDIYPDYRKPFTLQIERTLITDDGFPHIPHGWKVTMLSEDPLRDITARAIGIYNDSGGYLYTTGAFIDDGTGTYFTECPVGQRTADEVQINFKLLLGSAPEGAWTLLIGDEGDARQFWSADQGSPTTLDIDGDGKQDSEILIARQMGDEYGIVNITQDEDSVNIDLDGDGNADLVLPKTGVDPK